MVPSQGFGRLGCFLGITALLHIRVIITLHFKGTLCGHTTSDHVGGVHHRKIQQQKDKIECNYSEARWYYGMRRYIITTYSCVNAADLL